MHQQCLNTVLVSTIAGKFWDYGLKYCIEWTTDNLFTQASTAIMARRYLSASNLAMHWDDGGRQRTTAWNLKIYRN